MAQWNPKATAYTYPQSMVNIAICIVSLVHRVLIAFSRRADFTAIKMERSASRFLTNPTVTTALAV